MLAKSIRTLRIASLALAALMAMLMPSVARPLNDGELSSLRAKVEAFNADIRESRYEIVADTVPPRIMNHLAAKSGDDVSSLRQAMVDETRKIMASANINELSMNLSGAVYGEASDGQPYALVPTPTDVGTDDKRMVVKNFTLALLDGGNWYFIRVSDLRHIALLREIYPRFAGIVFPAGSTEAK